MHAHLGRYPCSGIRKPLHIPIRSLWYVQSCVALLEPLCKTPCLTDPQNGGLYCDENGEIQKPFPDKPYCQDGTGTVVAINKAGGPVSFCQTVLPGNEAMLIPTLVEETATLAVPDPSYWCSTAAQYVGSMRRNLCVHAN